MQRLVWLSLLLLLWAGSAHAQPRDLTGAWKGVQTRDGDTLELTLTFVRADPGYSGQFESDALQAAGVPLSAITDAAGKVHFEIKGDQTTVVFDGAIAGDAMAGTFTEGSSKGVFRLTRAAQPAPVVETREVTFASDGATLSGSLLLPAGGGHHAAVLFLQGSGPEGRWANRYLAQKFAEAGIAALIYDKRGVGQSTGDWRKADFEALARDGAAGVALLLAQPEVDPARVGAYGHSQGGTIAPLVAERSGKVAFVIAAAAGGADPAETEIYSVENALDVARLPAAEREDAKAYVRALVGVAYRGQPRAGLDALAMKDKARSWYFDPPSPDDAYWSLSRQDFRPATHWARVRVPVLLMFGAHDERIPARASIDAIKAALAPGESARVTVKLYPNADHTFTIVDPARTGGWPQREPDYAEVMIRWVRAQR